MKFSSKQLAYAAASFVILTGASFMVRVNAAQKLKPEELVEKHMASIGTPEARAAIKSRIVKGVSTVLFRPGPENKSTGNAAIISEGSLLRFSLIFAALNYPGEDFAFDGKKATTGYVRPGVRSQLAGFVESNDVLMREGFLGGALSTAWALLDPARKPRLEYNGLKKKDGKEYHEMRYLARRGGGDLRVFMYFDPETFRHMRTEYRLIMMGKTETQITITEMFDTFDVADGLTLPRKYTLRFAIEENLMIDWEGAFEQIQHNQPIDPKTFIVQQ
ncbi:MAG: hypothetical protein EHJ95_05935 [Methanobacteriota archaeon]|nr:MAG: hypothetical protein EHJ95_05935 [Euryarchaeota archaeon]